MNSDDTRCMLSDGCSTKLSLLAEVMWSDRTRLLSTGPVMTSLLVGNDEAGDELSKRKADREVGGKLADISLADTSPPLPVGSEAVGCEVAPAGGLDASCDLNEELTLRLLVSCDVSVEPITGLETATVANDEPITKLETATVANDEPINGLETATVANDEPINGLETATVANDEPINGLDTSTELTGKLSVAVTRSGPVLLAAVESDPPVVDGSKEPTVEVDTYDGESNEPVIAVSTSDERLADTTAVNPRPVEGV